MSSLDHARASAPVIPEVTATLTTLGVWAVHVPTDYPVIEALVSRYARGPRHDGGYAVPIRLLGLLGVDVAASGASLAIRAGVTG